MPSLLTNPSLESEHKETFYLFTFLTIPTSEPGLIIFILVYRFSQWGQGKQAVAYNLKY